MLPNPAEKGRQLLNEKKNLKPPFLLPKPKARLKSQVPHHGCPKFPSKPMQGKNHKRLRPDHRLECLWFMHCHRFGRRSQCLSLWCSSSGGSNRRWRGRRKSSNMLGIPLVFLRITLFIKDHGRILLNVLYAMGFRCPEELMLKNAFLMLLLHRCGVTLEDWWWFSFGGKGKRVQELGRKERERKGIYGLEKSVPCSTCTWVYILICKNKGR